MSSEAITRRLRLASELRDLSLSLMKSKSITSEQAAELRERRKKERAENLAKEGSAN